jgi:hypothetical protein
MTKILFVTAIIFTLLNCKTKEVSSLKININKNLEFRKLEKLFVSGEFDSDNFKDTIFQHNFSRLTNSEIEQALSPFSNEWESVVNWFYYQKAGVFLSISNSDTLYLGNAQGLYCLINIGDNNKDGKDEIAFVVDLLDFSNINTCKIFSLNKNGNWCSLKEFEIHEGSFIYESEKARPVFSQIKDFLEKHENQWFFKDNSQLEYDNEEDVGKLQKLVVEKCN